MGRGSPKKESSDEDLFPVPRRSKRSTKGKAPRHLIDEQAHIAGETHFEPRSYQDVCDMPDEQAKPWLKAMEAELNSVYNTWKVVKADPNMKLVDSRWIFKVKTNQSGEIVRYKARLVARGFWQVEGQDYHERFAPTVKYVTVRLMFKLAAMENLTTKHQDVTTAFLYGELAERIYMQPPEGVNIDEGMVCELQR